MKRSSLSKISIYNSSLCTYRRFEISEIDGSPMPPKPGSNIATIPRIVLLKRNQRSSALPTRISRITEMTDWVPALASLPGPRYLAFVPALEADIASGRVKPGMRLLPQRDMAQRLDLSVGTISKAYAEAEQRGLISGEVGRGTFVQRRRPEARGLGSLGGDDQSGAERPALYRRGRGHCIGAGRDRRRRRDVEPARLSAAPGPAPASRGDGRPGSPRSA